MLPQHEEEIITDELYGKDGVPSLEDGFEQKFLLFQGSFIEKTLLDHQFPTISDQLVLPMRLLHSSGRMWIISNDLRGVLPEMSNLRLKGHPLISILDFFKIDAMLISQWVEDVHALHCLFSTLLVAVDQVYPLVQALRHYATLKFLSQL